MTKRRTFPCFPTTGWVEDARGEGMPLGERHMIIASPGGYQAPALVRTFTNITLHTYFILRLITTLYPHQTESQKACNLSLWPPSFENDMSWSIVLIRYLMIILTACIYDNLATYITIFTIPTLWHISSLELQAHLKKIIICLYRVL